jgi:hypothetical protein
MGKDERMGVRLLVPVALAALAAVGCAGPRYRAGQWPDDVPPESRFAAVYASDARNRERQDMQEYFDWVLRFYKGNGLVPGWRAQEQTLAQLMGGEYEEVAEGIRELGRTVAAEWAKHNEVRRIDSDMLMVWGGVLRSAAKEHRAGRVVEQLTADARAVVEGKLAKADIRRHRYADVMAMK